MADDDHDVRLTATMSVGDHVRRRPCPSATMSVGDLGDARSVQVLERRLADDEEDEDVRLAAIDALGDIGGST